MYYDTIDSPVGRLTVSTDGTSITGLHIEGDRYFANPPASWGHAPDQPLLQQAASELADYFTGRRRYFDLPIAAAGTPFQQQVWTTLQQLSAGQTTTYSDIARSIGRPRAVRAVGTAIGRNPVCILVPCHRVLASDGGFGGYVAGIACKQTLLGIEGVTLGAVSRA